MGYDPMNKSEVLLITEKFIELLNGKSQKQFHSELVAEWGLDWAYGSFNSKIKNKTEWYLVHAYAISNKLGVDIKELFELKIKS